ncbi:MAG: S8 family peptidase [Clostridiales bacterium]|nr:S8 family peptidase [Clostridiales bacterium]
MNGNSNRDMDLEEFIKQPDTVGFITVANMAFREYIKDKPYIRIGTYLPIVNYVIAYTSGFYLDRVYRDLEMGFTSVYPQLFTITDQESNYAAGITPILNQPHLNLTGRGVLLGFVDTGIDYTKEAFRYEDGSSKIKYIWDQTISGNPPAGMHFGSVFTQERINEALAVEVPAAVVPHLDRVGHGTFLASVAASREKGVYQGVAADAEIIAVKLQRAHNYSFNVIGLSQNVSDVFESTGIILGIQYIIERATELRRPVVICLGIGTNWSPRDGHSMIEEYISAVSNQESCVIVASAGNESNLRRHVSGSLEYSGDVKTIGIQVGEDATSFSVLIAYNAWDRISISVKSPGGEVLERVPILLGRRTTKRLVFENSDIAVYYYQENYNGLAIVRLGNPTSGIWEIDLHGDLVINGAYHAWLSRTEISGLGVEFIGSNPNYTIVCPATAYRAISCGAYDGSDGSLYVSSSWGPTRLPQMSPDFVAPGVNVRGIFPKGYGSMTGTSVAAAITAGACALLLQWGVVNGNEPTMNSSRIKTLLISGCEREPHIQYPNTQWGYGKLNLLGTFNSLRQR